MGVSGKLDATPRKINSRKETRYILYRRWVGQRGLSGRVRKISPPPGFNPRTVQHVASCYTDCAISAHNFTGDWRNFQPHPELTNASSKICYHPLAHLILSISFRFTTKRRTLRVLNFEYHIWFSVVLCFTYSFSRFFIRLSVTNSCNRFLFLISP
jgi:hypothetical protein